MTDTKTDFPTEGEYTDAINTLNKIYGYDADQLVSMIETARDDVMFHDKQVTGGTIRGATVECTEDCVGCMTGRIADAVTRAVNGPDR